MDAFEQVVAEILWEEGYWVQRSVKVDLTKEQKRRLQNPSMPRPELDIVAYSGRQNAIKVVECKSYIDSRGVLPRDIIDRSSKGARRYKVFHNKKLRQAVFNQLRIDLARRGLCRPNSSVVLCLAAGRIESDLHRKQLRAHFKKMKWELFDDDWIKNQLRKMASKGYENQVSAIVVKLLERN